MRIIVSLASLAALAGTAGADQLHALDEGKVPPGCRSLERSPAPTMQLQLARRISVATCMAGIQLDAAQRTLHNNAGAAIQAFGDAVSPSITLLDEVIQFGEPASAIVAERAKGDLYVALAVRLRSTIPPVSPTTVGLALQQHDDAHAAIEPAVRPWLQAGDRAFLHATQLAQSHPELGPNPVVANAVRISNEMLDDTRAIVGAR